MSSITLLGDTSGSIIIDAPAIAGNGTLTLPRGTATLGINGPAFSVYLLNDMTLTNNTNTKIQFTTESFDTANCFDTTNYRFTPNVAGYYQFNYVGQFQGASSSTYVMLSLYKNGTSGATAPYHQGVRTPNSTAANMVYGTSVLLYANGTTDYFEVYAQQNSGGNLALYSFNGGGSTYFQGFLARAA